MAKKKSKTKSSTHRDGCKSDEKSEKTAKTPTLMKVCRLCETKDGPFLNVFDGDKLIGKKINELLPFTISEEDDLPHIICFRCSAKVEEMHEFVQKCYRTQGHLNEAMGRHTFMTKNKTRLLWYAKLNQSNMNNDDICNAIVKKAMVVLTNIPESGHVEDDNESKLEKRVSLKREAKSIIKLPIDDAEDMVPIKQLKLDTKQESFNTKTEIVRKSNKTNKQKENNDHEPEQKPTTDIKDTSINCLSFDFDDKSNSTSSVIKKQDIEVTPKETKPFNIMDHISTIKVNGVGTLFQCKLCNRNFLKKEVVLVHGCAKSSKPEVRKTTPPPEIPKSAPNTVKYINLKTDKDYKKPIEKPQKNLAQPVQEYTKPEVKVKPKIGPASKVKKTEAEPNPSVGMTIHPRAPTPPLPSVQFPTIPSLNSRYKLVPGPNNTFTLIEDPNSNDNQDSMSQPKKFSELKSLLKSKPDLVVRNEVINLDDTANSDNEQEIKSLAAPSTSKTKKHRPGPKNPKGRSSNVESNSATETLPPYPVGMFQLHQNVNQSVPNEQFPSPPPKFTTPAMRKQSYTVVQTGNPSKLLISTRPQVQTQEEPKPKQKSYKPDNNPPTKEPFKVTLEDATPKTSGFFTYVNIDPLLKPSHVIPSDDIIQESQISTSTKEKTRKDNKDVSSYPCHFCSETFSREKKLLSHIQAHYKQMDDEDEIRKPTDKPKKRK